MNRTVRHLLCLAVVVGAHSANAHSQSHAWRWIDPYPVGHNLQEIAVRPDGAVLVAGGHQTMIATTDRGESWRDVLVGDYRTINAITFDPAGRGWAVGTGGGVVRSPDGGLSWSPVDVGTIGAFNDVAFASADVGVIVGGAQLAGLGLLRTSDGGESWRVVPLAVAPTLTDVEFRGAVGIAVGAGGTILRTVDSGATWSIVGRDSATDLGSLEAVLFLGDDVVLAAGADERILRSTDRGLTWLPVRSAPGGRTLNDLAFGDERHGVAVGDRGEPLYTTDGGVTWSVSSAPLFVRTAALFTDPMTVLAVGTVGHVSRSTDGGVTWSTLSRAGVVADYYDVATDVTGRIAALGRDGRLVVFDSTQEQLVTLMPDEAIDLAALAWTPDGSVVAVGAAGRIVRWSGAAGSPRNIPSGSSARLTDITLLPSGLGWAVGAGTVLRTTDAGSSWSPVSSPTTDLIDGVGTYGDSIVWLVGRRGLVYRSTDAGMTWEDRRSPTTNFLTAVHALDRGRAIVVGASGVAMRTEDGGISWTFALVSGNPSLTDVVFVDGEHGVAVGYDAAAASTTDGGRTWTRHDVPVKEARVAGVHMLGAAASGRSVLAAGSGGVLLALDFEEPTGVPLVDAPSGHCASALISGATLELDLSCISEAAERVEVYDLLGRRIAAHNRGEGPTRAWQIGLASVGRRGSLFVAVTLASGRVLLLKAFVGD